MIGITQLIGDLQSSAPINIEYLIVAGGGGGGFYGGGGAGGMLTGSFTLEGTSIDLTVGRGGRPSGSMATSGATAGWSGLNSIIDPDVGTTLTAIGGGHGGRHDYDTAQDGGSGGGGGAKSYGINPGGNGTTGQGNNGGSNGTTSSPYASGGGGGAGGAGGNGSGSVSGNGGIGKQSSITGTATYYAGGGGGKTYLSGYTDGTGGSGGGGNASSAGSDHFGGGGGGGSQNGGSGIIILKFADSFTPTQSSAFNLTTSTVNSGGYKIISYKVNSKTSSATVTLTF